MSWRIISAVVMVSTAAFAATSSRLADAVEKGDKAEIRALLQSGADVNAAQLDAEIERLNADPAVTGYIVQLPLPKHLDANRVLTLMAPEKDADGLHPTNLGRLVLGEPAPLPCTPRGIVELLRRYNVPINGAEVVVVGRGVTVENDTVIGEGCRVQSQSYITAKSVLEHASEEASARRALQVGDPAPEPARNEALPPRPRARGRPCLTGRPAS